LLGGQMPPDPSQVLAFIAHLLASRRLQVGTLAVGRVEPSEKRSVVGEKAGGVLVQWGEIRV
jgi:hypothetical protein